VAPAVACAGTALEVRAASVPPAVSGEQMPQRAQRYTFVIRAEIVARVARTGETMMVPHSMLPEVS
jgi:hypothetical protein